MSLPRKRAGAALAATAALVVGACGNDSTSATTTAAGGGCTTVEAPAPKTEQFKKPEQVLAAGKQATATVQTNCGTFTIALDTKGSPKIANSFAFLAEKGFYDDTTFHRIAPGFLIQGGDPNGDGTGGPGYTVVEPPPQNTVYRKGLVAMGKTSVEPPGASRSQFFIVTAPADAGLPPDYAVLGKVAGGKDVVDLIAKMGDPATEQPTQTIVIDKLTIDAG